MIRRPPRSTLFPNTPLSRSHDVPLPPGHRARQWPVVLHSDWLGARRAMLRASAAIAIVGLLWVVTGWSGGAYMLLGMSIMLTVFSGFEKQIGRASCRGRV